MNNNPPVKLNGTVFTPVWSGNRLSSMYDRFKGSGRIGESWETSPDATVSVDGKEITFGEYLDSIGLPSPPLVKLLDAASPLSIQVHPDEYAASILGGTAKSEIWYILATGEDSYITYGTQPNVSEEELRDAILNGCIEPLLRTVPVRCGEVYMIPHGMIHSLGGGITVLEIQDRPGTTYRVKDISGNRETHVRESAECARIYSPEEAAALATNDASRLHRCPLHGDVIASTEGYAATVFEASDAPEALTLQCGGVYMFCLAGKGTADMLEFTAGESVFIPDAGCEIHLNSLSTVIFAV